jgi:hypothetical protein
MIQFIVKVQNQYSAGIDFSQKNLTRFAFYHNLPSIFIVFAGSNWFICIIFQIVNVMKTKLFFTAALSFCFYLLSSQVPQGFNYQAIARDGSGTVLASHQLWVRITLQTSLSGGTTIWQETHSVTTNELGVMGLVVGNGTRTGGTVALFSDIIWSGQPMFIKTEIDNGAGYIVMGTTELWSVPYSMVAKDLGGPVGKLGVKGTTANMDEALFEVKNRTGQTVFAVYNEGVRVYVDNGAKGAKGGFSIGGFGDAKAISQQYFVVSPDSIRAYIFDDPLVKGAKGGFSIGGFDNAKGLTNDYMMISPDSARIYINNAPSTKGAKGGFSIGGFDQAKAPKQEFLRVTRDSTRIYVKDPAKGAKGGFSIGGFDMTKGPVTTFTSLTPDNYFIGHNSGIRNTAGLYNSFIGFESGMNNTTGSNNVFLGYRAGYSNIGGTSTSGSYNVFIGRESGYLNQLGGFNTYLGYQAGYDGVSGFYNVFLGYGAGMKNLNSRNVYVGYESGVLSTNGYNNVFFGYWSGKNNTNGHDNVFLGTYSGNTNTTGSNNAFVGIDAGSYNTTGASNAFYGAYSGYKNTASNNTFVGYRAGYENTVGLDNVFIGTNSGEGAFGVPVTGSENTVLGSRSGLKISSGQRNIILGADAGNNLTTGQYNQFMGYSAGYASTGSYNIFLGPFAGYSSTSSQNIFAGYNSGRLNTSGSGGVFLGYHSGYSNTSGSSNVFIGQDAGRMNLTGTQNVYLGNAAGRDATGSYNVFIGTTAGYSETGSNKLIISNTTIGSPLVYGDFSTKLLTFNAEVKSLALNGFRLRGSSYGTILRNDGANFYFLVTDAGNADGIWNSLRPFSFSLATGEVTFVQNVGIGTYDPAYPLHVASSVTASCAYGYLNSSGYVGTSAGANYYSIFAENRIRAEEFNADSDERIKDVVGISNGEADMDILKRIKITDFRYIDSIGKGNVIHKKVLAQELNEVYPNAVASTTGFIPSIYSRPDSARFDKAGSRMIITMAVKHGLKKGDNVKFIESEGIWTAKVTEVDSPEKFSVSCQKDHGKVFVYGREVDDFMTVDYEAISMLNVSVTQELMQKMDRQQQQIESQNEKISRLEKLIERIVDSQKITSGISLE